MKEQPLAYSEQRDVNGLGNFETNQPSPFSAADILLGKSLSLTQIVYNDVSFIHYYRFLTDVNCMIDNTNWTSSVLKYIYNSMESKCFVFRKVIQCSMKYFDNIFSQVSYWLLSLTKFTKWLYDAHLNILSLLSIPSSSPLKKIPCHGNS